MQEVWDNSKWHFSKRKHNCGIAVLYDLHRSSLQYTGGLKRIAERSS
jgi:hypothetical protein